MDILTMKRDGRFTGEAFVVFGSPLQVEMALSKNKGYMGRRYIEVFRAKKLVGEQKSDCRWVCCRFAWLHSAMKSLSNTQIQLMFFKFWSVLDK